MQLDGDVWKYIDEALDQPFFLAKSLRRLPWTQGSLWTFVPTTEDERWPCW
jgi:hypothetical protein